MQTLQKQCIPGGRNTISLMQIRCLWLAEVPQGLKILTKWIYLPWLGDIINFVFLHLCKNPKIQNGRHFWKEKTFLNIWQSILLRAENLDKIALSRKVKEIEAILCVCIFGKNSKIQNGRHFLEREIIFENGTEYLADIPQGPKILTKSPDHDNCLWPT